MNTQEQNPVSVLYHLYLPRRMEGMELSAMRKEMAEKGADPATISKVIRLIDSEERRQFEQNRQSSVSSQWRVAGYICIAIGLVATGLSYVMAGPGGTYVFTVGLFVAGIALIMKG
jgi:hypothetical protein